MDRHEVSLAPYHLGFPISGRMNTLVSAYTLALNGTSPFPAAESQFVCIEPEQVVQFPRNPDCLACARAVFVVVCAGFGWVRFSARPRF